MVLLEDVGGMHCSAEIWQGGSGILLVFKRVAIDRYLL